jgi:uncharacterized LabA/DUF88 family protein
MKKPLKNYAFIDSQNLNLSIRDMGWNLDYSRFRKYLETKYAVKKAYLFVGFIEENMEMYESLIKAGYSVIFKELMQRRTGEVKGNCDAELVLQAMMDFPKYSGAVIVTGDGDFACLVHYLHKNKKLECVLVPNKHKFSALLESAAHSRLAHMNELKKFLSYRTFKKKNKKTGTGKTPSAS